MTRHTVTDVTDGSDVTTDTVNQCQTQESGRLTVSLLSTTADQPISQPQQKLKENLKHVKDKSSEKTTS